MVHTTPQEGKSKKSSQVEVKKVARSWFPSSDGVGGAVMITTIGGEVGGAVMVTTIGGGVGSMVMAA